MCVKSWYVHLCGHKVRHLSTAKCDSRIEANHILQALDPSGIIRNAFLEAESRRLHELCAQTSYELHHIEYIMGCEACMWKYASLGTAEVIRLSDTPQFTQRASKMCVTSVAAYLCGIRIRIIASTPCSAVEEAKELAKTLDPSGIIRSALREKEILRLHTLCRQESNERHLLTYYLRCDACADELQRLVREATAGEVPNVPGSGSR